jgi:PAS domain S-box-containing protein
MTIGHTSKEQRCDALATACPDTPDQQHAEQLFEQGLPILQALLDASIDGMMVTGRSEHQFLCNRQLLDIAGLPPDWPRWRSRRDRVAYVASKVKDPQAFLQRAEALQHNPSREIHAMLEMNDGRLLEEHSAPYRLGDTIIGRVWVVRDVTARQQTEEALRAELEEHKQAEQHLLFQARLLGAIGQSVIATTVDGTIIYWNQAAEALYGWKESEALGQSVVELTTADNERANETMRDLAQGRPWSGEFTAIRRDGTTFPVFGTTVPIQDDEQRLIGLIGISTDVSEQKHMEAALRESETRYRTLVETSPSAILLTDSDGTIRFCNGQAAHLFGYDTPGELHGHHSRTLVEPSMSHIGHVQLVAQTGSVRNVEYTMRRRDGSHFPAEVSSSVVTDTHGHPTALIILVNDISTRKLLQTRLIENERFVASGKLAASVAHEINTPLQAIQSSLNLLEKVSTPQEHQRFLKTAREEIRRVGMIVRQLLDLYRPLSTTQSPVDIHALIERILLLMSKQIRGAGIVVHTDIMPDMPGVWGHPNELTQIIFNLLSNATEAMPNGGELHVRGRLVDPATPAAQAYPDAMLCPDTPERPLARSIHIAIGDTGQGIAPDLLPRIFEPFVTTRAHGTGQGLTITMQIVKQHSGYMLVESTPGQGSVFRVVLPVDAPASEPSVPTKV